VPLEATELEGWLEARAADLRAAWPTATIRLFRLTQQLSSGRIDVGWLLEAALPAEDDDIAPWLAETLRDMRILGFQPALSPDLHEVPALRDALVERAQLGVDFTQHSDDRSYPAVDVG
jgi:hypothetical protein